MGERHCARGSCWKKYDRAKIRGKRTTTYLGVVLGYLLASVGCITYDVAASLRLTRSWEVYDGGFEFEVRVEP